MKEVIKRVKRNYRMIVSNIKRILYYLPLIWGIREWDHTYSMAVYVHQLKYQSKYLAQDGMLVRSHYDSIRMNRVVRLLEIGYELDMEHQDAFFKLHKQKNTKVNFWSEYEKYQEKARRLAHKYILEEGGHWWD